MRTASSGTTQSRVGVWRVDSFHLLKPVIRNLKFKGSGMSGEEHRVPLRRGRGAASRPPGTLAKDGEAQETAVFEMPGSRQQRTVVPERQNIARRTAADRHALCADTEALGTIWANSRQRYT